MGVSTDKKPEEGDYLTLEVPGESTGMDWPIMRAYLDIPARTWKIWVGPSIAPIKVGRVVIYVPDNIDTVPTPAEKSSKPFWICDEEGCNNYIHCSDCNDCQECYGEDHCCQGGDECAARMPEWIARQIAKYGAEYQ